MTTITVDDLDLEETLGYPDTFRILTGNKKDDDIKFTGRISIQVFPYTRKFNKVQVTITDQKVRSLSERDSVAIRVIMEVIEINQDGVNVSFLFAMLGSGISKENSLKSNLSNAKLSIPIQSISNYMNLDLGSNYFVTLQFKE